MPIVLSKKTIGILGVEEKAERKKKSKMIFTFLDVVASMIAQAAKSQFEIIQEKEKFLPKLRIYSKS